MKAVLPLLLCLTLLAGCMPVSAYAALPEVLAERVEGSSVSEIAEENLVLKLFPLEGGQDLQWLLHADVDAAAQDLLGQELERLTEALPLLCLSMQLAREGGLEDVEADQDQTAERFRAALPQCALLFAEEVSQTVDGRLFLSEESLSRWAAGFQMDLAQAAQGLTFDEGNGGYLLSRPDAPQSLSLELLTALESPDAAGSVRLDVRAVSGEETWRALITLRAAEDGEGFGLRLCAIHPLDADASPFLYAQPALNLDQESAYPQLQLTLRTGDGLRVEEHGQSLSLYLGLPGTVQLVSDSSAQETPPRASLWIQAESEGRPHAEDSAYASAAAAQQGYAGQGMELVDLSVGGCVFLGSNDAYVLRYTVLSAQGEPLESVEHYVVEAENDLLYHFVYRFLPGYTQREMELLYMATQTVRFTE